MIAMKRRGWAFALPLIIAAAPIGASAAGPCYPRDAIHAHLAERYGERPVGVGVTAGQLVELLVRPDGASWTVSSSARTDWPVRWRPARTGPT